MMDISFSNELSYMNANSSSQEMFFYSVPTSPNILKLRQHQGSQTGPTTPRSYEEETGRGFEFETGCSDLANEKNQKDVRQSEATMAFADELFCDGKVKPLKLPPRLFQKGDQGNNMSSTQSSTATSPKSPGSMLKLPFSRLWKDDFDPFTVALEKIREDKRGNSKVKHDLRRTRSHCDTTTQLIYEELLKQASGRENMLFEPKELEVDGDKNIDFELKRNSVSKVAKETKKDESQRGGFLRRNIKKFLFRKGNMSKQKLLEDKKEAKGKPKLLKKVDMASVTSTESSTLWNEDERKGELTKMRLVCNNRPLPKFSLCLGYEGLKGKKIRCTPSI